MQQHYSIDILRSMEASCAKMRERLKEAAFRPENHKTLDIAIGPTMAAELIGRTPEAIAKAEARGRLPQPKQSSNGRRYYTVEDLSKIRELLKIQVGKADGEETAVVAIQNFKGGVSKSTTTKHFADYLGLRGYRVLVIDMDPQASTTTMFGIQPETLMDEENVLSNFLSPRHGISELAKCIRPTSWPTIDIIPSNLGLQDAEWELTGTLKEGVDVVLAGFQALRYGIDQVRDSYDIILLDPPPALGFLGLNTMAAANALVIPVPARQLDYLSTIHFLGTIAENLEVLESSGVAINYSFIKVLCSMFSPNRPGETDMWAMMKATYGGHLISQPILHSEEIKNATATFQSIYEANKAFGSHQTYQRCRQNLDAVFGEIERHIKEQWPSHNLMTSSDLSEAA